MPERSRGQKPAYQTGIAKERIVILLGLAKKEFGKNPERSRRYVLLARKIGMRYNVRLPQEWKRRFCRGCGTLLELGRGTTIIKCGKCNRIYRYPSRRKSKVG
ncbi:MAG: ribonuclease P [Candidatus Aenigmatarchaeota archaeon]